MSDISWRKRPRTKPFPIGAAEDWTEWEAQQPNPTPEDRGALPPDPPGPLPEPSEQGTDEPEGDEGALHADAEAQLLDPAEHRPATKPLPFGAAEDWTEWEARQPDLTPGERGVLPPDPLELVPEPSEPQGTDEPEGDEGALHAAADAQLLDPAVRRPATKPLPVGAAEDWTEWEARQPDATPDEQGALPPDPPGPLPEPSEQGTDEPEGDEGALHADAEAQLLDPAEHRPATKPLPIGAAEDWTEWEARQPDATPDEQGALPPDPPGPLPEPSEPQGSDEPETTRTSSDV
jgi:hypothetical protein